MSTKVLYIGDTSLQTAASYLAGVMSYHGINFDYIPCGQQVDIADIDRDYAAFIISDYPASGFSAAAIERLRQLIETGAGLFMPGGWDSFTGLNGCYGKSPLADVLPVLMQDEDDRINSSSPCIVSKSSSHPVVNGLDFDNDAPCIGGFNGFKAKTGTHTVLSTLRYKAKTQDGQTTFEKLDSYPLLVLGNYGKARTAALATDVAPHWVGGLVDWGKSRVSAKANGSTQIEVGSDYAVLLGNIVKWAAGFEL